MDKEYFSNLMDELKKEQEAHQLIIDGIAAQNNDFTKAIALNSEIINVHHETNSRLSDIVARYSEQSTILEPNQ